MFGVKHFHCYLYGRVFTLEMGHRPLLSLFSESRAQASGRIQWWALTLVRYEYNDDDDAHRKGSEHVNADTLSRLPLPTAVTAAGNHPANGGDAEWASHIDWHQSVDSA